MASSSAAKSNPAASQAGCCATTDRLISSRSPPLAPARASAPSSRTCSPPSAPSGDPVMSTPDDHPDGVWLPNVVELLAKAEATAERKRIERLQERERADQLAGEVTD